MTRLYCCQSRSIELRARVGDVAERPQRVVGEPVVVALLFFGREPDPPQRVGRVVGRHLHAPLRVRTSRSPLPLPCAIHVPPHARITGSSAVTRPLAGTIHDRLVCSPRPPNQLEHAAPARAAVRFTWMYGSRFATTISFVLLRRGPSAAMQFGGVHRCLSLFPGREPPEKGIDICDAVKLMRSERRPRSDENADAAVESRGTRPHP